MRPAQMPAGLRTHPDGDLSFNFPENAGAGNFTTFVTGDSKYKVLIKFYR